MEDSNRTLALGLALLGRRKKGELTFIDEALAFGPALNAVLEHPETADAIIAKVPKGQWILALLRLNFAKFPLPPVVEGQRTEQIETLLKTLRANGYKRHQWTSSIHERDFQARDGIRFGFLEGDWLCVQSRVKNTPWALWVSSASAATTYFLPDGFSDESRRNSWGEISNDPHLVCVDGDIEARQTRIGALLKRAQ